MKNLKYSHGANSERLSINCMVRNVGTSTLRVGRRAAICLLRWVVCELLPLPMSTRAHHLVAAACRLAGCAVAVGILSVELQRSGASHGLVLACLWTGSALTAVLIGNIARELLFALSTSVATLLGQVFQRDGATLGGRTFLEVHYPTMTWIRCECADDEFTCEWTEPTGRCNRVEIQLRANSGRAVETPRSVIRVMTAPRMSAD
ncbi:MAG TPA: hypothetical protein VK700_22640 [Steroidobacteraceae bacterium]|jgi:hypothetical protein|nr:hypothetical protein [Steroidobacteraceae bacterium]